VDQEAIALLLQAAMGLRQGFRRRSLQEGAGGGVERRADEVVRRGVADVELDGGVEGRQVDEVGREAALLGLVNGLK